MSPTSPIGGYSDGILGCFDPAAGQITLISGWGWYAGADATQIGSNQYDFQTTVTHELGHALDLGESDNPTSAMYGTLAPGTAVRTLTVADLNIPYDEGAADPENSPPDRLSAHAIDQVFTVDKPPDDFFQEPTRASVAPCWRERTVGWRRQRRRPQGVKAPSVLSGPAQS